MAAVRTVTQKAIAIGALLLSAAAVPAQAQTPKMPSIGYGLKEPTTPEEIAAAKPNPQTPGFRIPLPPLDQMDPAMREDFESNAKRLKTPVPPTAALMLTPDIKASVGGVLRPVVQAGLPQDLWELSVLMVARAWDVQFEWWVHAPQALHEGIPAETVEAIRTGHMPTAFANPGQDAAYHFLLELFRDHKVSDATYEKLRAIIGTQRVVALTVLVGYYGIDAVSFIAQNLPFRADVKPPLPVLARNFPAK